MGTTFGCAQCHNHKYDPFTQKEYYQVFAIFNNTADANTEEPTLEARGSAARLLPPSARLTEAKQRLEEGGALRALGCGHQWKRPLDRSSAGRNRRCIVRRRGCRGPEQINALAHHRSSSPDWLKRDAQVKRLRTDLDQIATTTLVMKEAAPRPTQVAIRGEYQNRGDPVTPGVPPPPRQKAGCGSIAPGWYRAV